MKMARKDELIGLKAIALHRVSSDKQDLDLQQKAANDFCLEFGLELIDEYFEEDVSGFKTPLSDRVELLKILNRAKYDKDFQILIVFLQDRIGRREDETPSVIQDLSRSNVRCFESSTFQELDVSTHEGKLINYVKSWTSELESIKTSLRVKEGMAVKNEAGMYMGGTVPYGYTTYFTGEINKKGKALRALEIDVDEAVMVKLIFHLYTKEGMGTTAICNYLNENYPYSSRKKKKFTPIVIHKILQNKVYIGYKTYNKFTTTRDKRITLDKDQWKTQPYNENLRLIDDEMFEEAQKLLIARKKNKGENVKTTTISKYALCSGLVYCKCGTKMRVGYSESPYTKKNGERVKNRVYTYFCPVSRYDTKEHLKISKQKSISIRKIDPYIDEYIKNLLKNFNEENYSESLMSNKDNEIKQKEKMVLSFKEEANKKEQVILKYKQLIDDCVLKEDLDKIDIFIENIRDNKALIDGLNSQIRQLEDDIVINKGKNTISEQDINRIKDLQGKYENLNLNSKRSIVSLFIKKIIVVDDKFTIESALPEKFFH